MKKDTDQFEFPEGFFKKFKTKEGFNDFFQKLLKQGVEAMLRAELDEHLGYEKHSPKGYNSGNSRGNSSALRITT